ncbi:PLDc N-terminal domain-containing protein [Ferruginibacter yonginensis]|uniref:PLDc N-terminal domain-containing protein n=1 Tax=Ferruginibacter yonginensis TaxID=1310416 RepID=A0ABV8QTV7_9BACT
MTSNFNPPSPKFVWLFVVFVFGIFGGFIYVLIGKQTKYYE